MLTGAIGEYLGGRQPLVFDKGIDVEVDELVVHKFALAYGAFFFKVQALRYGLAFKILRTASYFNTVQVQFRKTIVDELLHRTRKNAFSLVLLI
jgi:hypothetical protein